MTVSMRSTCSGNAEENLVRVAMALAKSSEARAKSGEEILEYLAITFHVSELPPLRYFRIFIEEHSESIGRLWWIPSRAELFLRTG